MKLPEFSVRRPVTVLMLILIIAVLGTISFLLLPIELMPDLTFPVASVITSYEGVASEDIETLVTKPIEAAVSKVKNVKTVDSISQEGLSIVTVEFEWGTNIDFAAQDMRDSIGVLREYLPSEIDDPIVVKFDPTMIPVIVYGITGNRGPRELRTLVKDNIKDRIEMVDGVATAMIMGGREREIQVNIDRGALEARNLPIEQVIQKLRYENLNLSGGHITRGHIEYLLRTLGEFETLDEIQDTIVGVASGRPIRVKDIATVSDTHKEVRNYARVNGRSGVLLAVVKQSGANTTEVVDRVKKQVEELRKELPPDIRFYTALDQGKLTKVIVGDTGRDALWGGLVAVLLLFLTLRNWRPTATIALSVPFCILATLVPVVFFGYTLNVMTMAGLALGVGMLVSNAIIVIENIFRHMEEGKDRFQAAISGTSEVGMAITASTATTVAVFLPLFFASGIAGKLSKGLAITVAFSLLASLLVALSLVPMIASKIFRPAKEREQVRRPREKGYGFFGKTYEGFIRWALRHRYAVTISLIAIFAFSMALSRFVGKEFMPAIDSGLVIIKVEMPEGTSLEETDRVVRQVEDVMMAEEGLDVVCSFTGTMEGSKLDVAFGMSNSSVNEAQIFAHAVDKAKRERTTTEIQDSIRKRLPRVGGGRIEFMDLARMITSAGTGQIPIEVKIFGKETKKLEQLASQIANDVKPIDGLYDVDTTLRYGKPELQIRVDRQKASQMGLSVAQIASVVRTAFEGQVATLYRTGGDEFDLRVKYREQDRKSVRDLLDTVVSSPFGSDHKLAEVCSVAEGKGPVRLFRENQKRKASVSANFSGRDLGSILADIRTAISGITFDEGYFVEYGGEAKRMRETFSSLGVAFALSVLLIYMIMAAQFESLVHPFTVMFTVPFGLVGVILILLGTGVTLSFSSLLGVIVLAGIVVNNGIVLVDYVNQLRADGLEKHDALVKASLTKMRAILLTAAVTVVGMTPMAISRGVGAEIRAPIALAVIGGMIISTVLLLVIIPTVYSILDDIAHRTRRAAARLLHGESDKG